jgi:hypothetical protein
MKLETIIGTIELGGRQSTPEASRTLKSSKVIKSKDRQKQQVESIVNSLIKHANIRSIDCIHHVYIIEESVGDSMKLWQIAMVLNR